MIQELQNLRGQMRCILLVSHQEDFAEAFPDGYHFRLDGGRDAGDALSALISAGRRSSDDGAVTG